MCTHTERIASYISAATDMPLPVDVGEKAKLHILDSIAAIISGGVLKPGRFGADFARQLGGPTEATILANGTKVSAINAALANGMAGHADETDDSHLASRSHLGCAVVPAALAMSERKNRNGASFLRAVATGYDIGARATMALGYGPARTQKHSTHSLAGLFGASAAAAALAGLNTGQCAVALSFAAQQASGIPSWNRDSEHIEKAFDFGGMAARNGVFAAMIVEAGASGVTDVMTGRHSYIDAFAERPDADALTRGLGEHFEITNASIKKWSVGSPIQAALDALEYLMKGHQVTPRTLKAMTVHIPDDRLHVVSDREVPDICLQHLLAIMVVDGGLTFASSHNAERMSDASVLAVRRKISAVPSTELTHARPARQAIVEIQLENGETIRQRTHAVLGTPDNPMSTAQVCAKAHDLMAPVLGAQRSERIIDAVMKLETIDDMRQLAQMATPGHAIET